MKEVGVSVERSWLVVDMDRDQERSLQRANNGRLARLLPRPDGNGRRGREGSFRSLLRNVIARVAPMRRSAGADVGDDIAGDALVRTEHEDAFGMRRGELSPAG